MKLILNHRTSSDNFSRLGNLFGLYLVFNFLIRDAGTKTKEELRTLMRDRDLWRRISAIDRT